MMRAVLVRVAWGVAITFTLATGCVKHPDCESIIQYMETDRAYQALPYGTERVDALYVEAVRVTGSPQEALELLGSLSVSEGAKLRDPFDTGLTDAGILVKVDKTGHFFSNAMWRTRDHEGTALLSAKTLSYVWEVFGEVKHYVASGDGFDWHDIWANELGWAFADRLHEAEGGDASSLLPSDIIRQAERYRPDGSHEKDGRAAGFAAEPAQKM